MNSKVYFIREKINLVFCIHNSEEIRLLSWLSFDSSHLNEGKFRLNFRDKALQCAVVRN